MGRRRVPQALVATVAVVLLAALADVAGARRDDLPTETRTPASGATVADATHGVAVEFTCPVYHQFTYDITTQPAEGYHVILARSGEVGADRLLLAANRVEDRGAVLVEGKPGMCTAEPDAADDGLLPREPGTYWWQPYRECATYLCPGGVEVGDPSSVTVTRTVCSTNRTALAQARRDLATARSAVKRRRTAARRDRVARLDARVTTLRSRLRVVYRCAA